MYDADGTFNDNHINNWQHAAMYFGYMVAGIVDVVGHFTGLPADSSQVRRMLQMHSCVAQACLHCIGASAATAACAAVPVAGCQETLPRPNAQPAVHVDAFDAEGRVPARD